MKDSAHAVMTERDLGLHVGEMTESSGVCTAGESPSVRQRGWLLCRAREVLYEGTGSGKLF